LLCDWNGSICGVKEGAAVIAASADSSAVGTVTIAASTDSVFYAQGHCKRKNMIQKKKVRVPAA
jgi:hypothetical protein